MEHATMKKCSVVLKPCTPDMKKCYVSLNQFTPKCGNVASSIGAKKSVTIEPSTPLPEPELTAELRKAINEKNILTQKTKTKFISALNELEEANKETYRKSRKSQTSREIIDSEITYLKQLDIIVKFFKKPLEDNDLLQNDEIEKLFGTISVIHNVNKELLRQLQQTPTNVAQAFSKLAPFLKLYSAYAYDYKLILDILKKAECNEEFNKFLNNQESRPEVQTKLSSLLITPIQRIPRYCLLLRKLLINTLPIEEDYNTIKDSLEKVEESAKHVDKLVADRENSISLLQIQKALQHNTPMIVKPGRKLIKDGPVVRLSGTQMKRMYLVAMTDILMFCKIRKENVKGKNALQSSFIFPLHKCKIRQNPTARNVEIRCDNEIVTLFIEKLYDFDEWIKVIKASIVQCRGNRSSLHKESSWRRPAFKKDVDSYSEIGISPGRPQRKRKIIDGELELGHDNSSEVRSSVPLISKRKCLRNYDFNQTDSKTKDVLHPLRHHYLSSKTYDNFEDKPAEVENQPSVFVFGHSGNENKGFNFMITNFFTTIGSSFKKLFGWK